MTLSRALPSDFVLDATGSPRGRERPAELSSWPFTALFIGYPLWWVLGLGDIAWVIFSVPMVVNLVRAGGTRAPRGFGVWLLFLLWMTISVIELDTGGRVVGFVFRALSYGAATVIFLYVYNASERGLGLRRVTLTLTYYWGVVVAGGYLGVLLPSGSFTTPLARVLPAWLQANDLVFAMVHPRFAQLNAAASAEFVAPRPSAPFIYTNGWGSSFSLLLPLVLVALLQLRRGPAFWFVAVLVPVSFVPAFLTLNRGLFLALTAGFGYAALRFALRREIKGLLAVGAMVAVVGVLSAVVPVQDLVNARVENSDTNETRSAVYREAIDRTQESPLLGYGAPRPSEETAGGPAAGTQGQFWMVLFSHGFPGAFFFLSWLLVVVWSTARSATTTDMWLHVVCAMTLLENFYYGLLTSGLVLFMVAAALAMRRSAQRVTVSS